MFYSYVKVYPVNVDQVVQAQKTNSPGPYVSAILRFQISFPSNYPLVPPLITFSSDIFHPLVTPLTTYTYTTGSLISDPVSATDEERLPPGGFSLRFGFPHWFGRAEKTTVASSASSRNASGSHSNSSHASVGLGINNLQDFSRSQITQFQRLQPRSVSSQAMRDPSGTRTSIIEILEYLKSSFDDESTLDALPIEASGNPGAWNAWQAYRKHSLSGLQIKIGSSDSARPSKQDAGSTMASNRKQPEAWSWDGVWEERVQKGVDASISDSVLYGNPDGGDDLVCCQLTP